MELYLMWLWEIALIQELRLQLALALEPNPTKGRKEAAKSWWLAPLTMSVSVRLKMLAKRMILVTMMRLGMFLDLMTLTESELEKFRVGLEMLRSV